MASTQNQSLNKEDDNACLYAMHLSTSHIFPMALTAAIELNLFDIIASRASRDAYMSPSEIASQLPTKNPNAPFLLDRMLRLLAAYSLLTCSMRTCEDGRVERLYGLSPAGKFFAQNEDGGLLSSMTLLNSHPNVAEVWRHLKDAILEEGNLYEKVCGTANIFKYMEADPALNKIFNKAMADISGISMRKILETYKGFEGVSLLVDVGGCSGADLNTIISEYPSIRGINFDLPHMIQHGPSYPGVEHVVGDMYVSVPTGDAIMIKGTCHNWSDEHCINFLKNCHKALQQNGKVIIIDLVLPDAPESADGAKFVSATDNIMLVLLGGKERTAKEFEALSKKSGFSGFHVNCVVYNVWGVMELYK